MRHSSHRRKGRLDFDSKSSFKDSLKLFQVAQRVTAKCRKTSEYSTGWTEAEKGLQSGSHIPNGLGK